MSDFNYDEFSMFHENLSEWGLDRTIPKVRRFHCSVDGLRQLSGLQWGTSTPELSLVHGGAQNAHTFDTVALALERPLLAIDLPGHGHSDPSPYPASAVTHHADDVAEVLRQMTVPPRPLVGMSLGGLTSLVLSHRYPELVSSLMLIDITPGVNPEKAQHITAFVNGPKDFGDFNELLQRTIAHNPTRSESSLRRGILHNALQRPDGTWVWRHQQHGQPALEAPDNGDLWQLLGELSMPVTLIRAMGPGSVVDDEDEAEFRRRLPEARIVHVTNSGHSVQGDQPLELAALIERFCFD